MPLFDRGGGRGEGDGDAAEPVLRVSQVNRMVRALIEERWRNVWIEGELSDVTRAASGHVYFTLNDESDPAQLRGVMFRADAARAKARLEDGARVKMRGGLSLFEPRGAFQLIARIALPHGLGELQARREALRRKLEQEGLLAPERKRSLPRFPRVVGLVTSEHGAALHDIVRVASDRFPVRLVLSPCLVQGKEAPASVVAALALIQGLDGLDVVIVGRGGGSAEDLWVFDDERVARAIAACRVPTVSAVGHEIDVTIADLVADVRAATPSNAAELCVPERRALAREVAAHERALARAMEARIDRLRLRLERAGRGLPAREAVIGALARRIDALRVELVDAARLVLAERRDALDALAERLALLDPRLALGRTRARLAELAGRMAALGRPLVAASRARLSALTSQLDALSPLAVLGRGYAIALHGASGKALLRAGDAAPGDAVVLHLHEGRLHTRVERGEP